MRHQIPGVAFFLLLCSCGEGTSAPSGPLLLGQWELAGDSPALLIGLRVAAELQLACSSVGINEPVELSLEGHFAFEGRLHTSTLTTESPKAQVSGRVEAERVSLTVDVLGDGVPAQTLTLHAGVDPAFDELPPICPL